MVLLFWVIYYIRTKQSQGTTPNLIKLKSYHASAKRFRRPCKCKEDFLHSQIVVAVLTMFIHSFVSKNQICTRRNNI